MPTWLPYAGSAILVVAIALRGLFAHPRMLGKIVAANLLGSGVLLMFVALARRSPDGIPDPVVHALVLTSIVVSVSATALALALLRRLVDDPADDPSTSESDVGTRDERGPEPRSERDWERRCGD